MGVFRGKLRGIAPPCQRSRACQGCRPIALHVTLCVSMESARIALDLPKCEFSQLVFRGKPTTLRREGNLASADFRHPPGCRTAGQNLRRLPDPLRLIVTIRHSRAITAPANSVVPTLSPTPSWGRTADSSYVDRNGRHKVVPRQPNGHRRHRGVPPWCSMRNRARISRWRVTPASQAAFTPAAERPRVIECSSVHSHDARTAVPYRSGQATGLGALHRQTIYTCFRHMP
jgi:hypothetical protein